MLPANKLIELISETVVDLPYDKQQEVYDFAAYLKSKTKPTAIEVESSGSFGKMVGIINGPADLSSNHDEIYD